MSLVGNLEDLALGEILQIVCLSRKTGILYLSSSGREGSICFREGQVVSAAASSCQLSLGEILTQQGIIDPTVLDKALIFQKDHGFRDRLGTILVSDFGLSADVVEQVVCEQIENIVFSLFTWVEGSFNFAVHDDIETADSIRMDPLQFMLNQGLNPQFLAMEGTRILDEMNSSGEKNDPLEDDADFAFDLVGSSVPRVSSAAAVNRPVVIVDDDGPTLQILSDYLARNGFVVHALARSEDTLIKVDELYRSGAFPMVLIDLAMPRMDGTGEFGGLELLDLLHNNFKGMLFVVMTDIPHEEHEKLLREMGYPFIIKPGPVEINTPDIQNNFLAQLLHDIPQFETQLHERETR